MDVIDNEINTIQKIESCFEYSYLLIASDKRLFEKSKIWILNGGGES